MGDCQKQRCEGMQRWKYIRKAPKMPKADHHYNARQVGKVPLSHGDVVNVCDSDVWLDVKNQVIWIGTTSADGVYGWFPTTETEGWILKPIYIANSVQDRPPEQGWKKGKEGEDPAPHVSIEGPAEL